MKKLVAAILFGSMIFYMSCSGSKDDSVDPPSPPAATCDGVAATFATTVSPIISSSCATNSGCHGAGSANGPGQLTTYDEIKAASAAIKSAVVAKTMPKGGSLSAGQINSIKCWVDNGAVNN